MRRFVLWSIASSALFCSCTEIDSGTVRPVTESNLPNEASHGTKDQSAKAADDSSIFEGPQEAIFEGDVAVDIMGIGIPLRAEELSVRLEQAVQLEPEWWAEVVSQAEPGQPPAYDTRFGLTEAEYDELISYADQTEVRKLGDATLVITETEDGSYQLNGGEMLSGLTGIVIDLKNDVVQTPAGVAEGSHEIRAPESTAIGAWHGIAWRKPDQWSLRSTGPVFSLAVGKLKESGRLVMDYSAVMASGDEYVHVTYLLFYDKP